MGDQKALLYSLIEIQQDIIARQGTCKVLYGIFRNMQHFNGIASAQLQRQG